MAVAAMLVAACSGSSSPDRTTGRALRSYAGPALLSPVAPTHGVTATQLAAGRWSNIARGPRWLGNARLAAAWIHGELLVVGYRSAAGYDPATNTWRTVSRPPSAFHGNTLSAVVAGGRLYVIASPGNRVAEWDKRQDSWRMLPRFPACRYCQPVLVAHHGRVMGIAGRSELGTGVAELRAGRWISSAAIPIAMPRRAAVAKHAGRPVPQMFAGYVGARLYALAATKWQARRRDGKPGAFAGSLQLFKQVGKRWQKLAMPNLPVAWNLPDSRQIAGWGGHLEVLVTALCNGFGECLNPRGRALVISTDGRRNAMSNAAPLSSVWYAQLNAGDAVIAVPSNAGAPDNLRQWPTDRPSAAALDLKSGDWLTLPQVPQRGVYGNSLEAWTPYGPVMFWSAQSRRSSGAILRIARAAR
ncbi:MAG TPA: hypothetical protein VHD81_07495 [Mycobacteriales bacterium]|nr:hypothetical protein [Mycobacteriales bacterium]